MLLLLLFHHVAVMMRVVMLFVHGVATPFDESIYTAAELWHYAGREFIPVAFSWPAGKKGLLRGYTYDRESSEFAVLSPSAAYSRMPTRSVSFSSNSSPVLTSSAVRL